jgi:hypothetical protein
MLAVEFPSTGMESINAFGFAWKTFRNLFLFNLMHPATGLFMPD